MNTSDISATFVHPGDDLTPLIGDRAPGTFHAHLLTDGICHGFVLVDNDSEEIFARCSLYFDSEGDVREYLSKYVQSDSVRTGELDFADVMLEDIIDGRVHEPEAAAA